MVSNNLKILLVENSEIIKSGLEVQLKKLTGTRIQILEAGTIELLYEAIKTSKPNILIINPIILNGSGVLRLREECKSQGLKCIALISGIIDSISLRNFDDQITICDSFDDIKAKIEKFYLESVAPLDDEIDEQQTLSSREKEIVVCVVKGLTNREIADKLYLSTHTVITHRRNIARKLQIHSPSGLTIYAIVNKLVELSDIQ